MSSPDGRCRVVELDLVEFRRVWSAVCWTVQGRLLGDGRFEDRFEGRPVDGV